VDRDKVINGGSWMILDHYVAIRPWTTDFISSQVKINKTLVWIRFPSLGMEYYDESLLLALATAVGTPVKVDIHTLDASRGKFARVCVEINLEESVVGKFWFRDFWYHVEYEGLHLLCKSCGMYGHVARNCPTKISSQEKVSTTTLGGAPEKPTITESAPKDQPNLESSDMEAKTKEDELYGDWLVVNRKRNQGKKPGPRIQDHPANIKGGALQKSPTHGLPFSHLSNAGILNVEEIKKQEWDRHFHPGGITDSPKVWTKKNKRARGMNTNNREPNNLNLVGHN
jgi:hypothetical protein